MLRLQWMTSKLFLWLRDGVLTSYPVATGGCDVIDHMIVVIAQKEVAVVSFLCNFLRYSRLDLIRLRHRRSAGAIVIR